MAIAQLKPAMDGDPFTLSAPQAVDIDPSSDLWATFYYVHPAPPVGKGIPLRNTEGRAISAPVSAKDFCLGSVEGTLRTRDLNGRLQTYNFAALVADKPGESPVLEADSPGTKANPPKLDCRDYIAQKDSWVSELAQSRYRLAHGPYGDGAFLTQTEGYALVPYRSIAADPARLKAGTVLYIPAARGLRFRNGAGQPVFMMAIFSWPMSGQPSRAITSTSSPVRTSSTLSRASSKAKPRACSARPSSGPGPLLTTSFNCTGSNLNAALTHLSPQIVSLSRHRNYNATCPSPSR